MPRFRKRPVVVEAMQFDGNMEEVVAFIGGEAGERFIPRPPDAIGIVTLEGTMWAGRGDWIIRGVQGEFYPCKPDIFEQTYEEVGHVLEPPADMVPAPSVRVASKLASLVVHADEFTSPNGHEADRAAIRSLVDDGEVMRWLTSVDPALLPVKRDG